MEKNFKGKKIIIGGATLFIISFVGVFIARNGDKKDELNENLIQNDNSVETVQNTVETPVVEPQQEKTKKR